MACSKWFKTLQTVNLNFVLTLQREYMQSYMYYIPMISTSIHKVWP